MLSGVEYKKLAKGSKNINSYYIRKMTHFTPCGVKWVSSTIYFTMVRDFFVVVDFISESYVNI